MTIIKSNAPFVLILFAILSSCQPKSIELAGSWKFQTDPGDVGVSEQWFSLPLSGEITLPGSMVSNGLGDDITMETKWIGGIRNPNWSKHPNYAPYHDPQNIRFPYWLQPDKKYYGAAWYQKTIRIPATWTGNPLTISLERPHWETTMWIDNEKIGTRNSLATPHEYILPDGIQGRNHILTIRVDNRVKEVDVGQNSHSISDHTQSNWNGMVGELKIACLTTATIQSVRIFPDSDNKKIFVEGTIFYTGTDGRKARIKTKVTGSGSKVKGDDISLTLTSGLNPFTFEIKLGENALLWDEFSPNLYDLKMELISGRDNHIKHEQFGLRKIKAGSTGLTLNNHPLFLRGTLECAIFPLTGYPSCNIEDWKRIFSVIKSHGLNHMRFHSWCPPEAAFFAADEMGVYLQAECSSWANQTTSLGDGLPIDKFIWEESRSIMEAYGNHPSFIMLAYGNEPGGRDQNAFLTEFVKYWKENDSRRLYTSAAGWPQLPVNDYHNVPQPRIQGWGEGLHSVINAQAPKSDYDWTSKLPADGITVVSHEIGQWCVYPNFKEIDKYTGVLKAKNFELFQESLEANKMGHLADSFLLASGKLQALCYKADIEAALRTPRFGGFQLLDLHDFPGQGTALVGVLDPFWEEKGYISPEEFSNFCNSTVPLARLSKLVFIEGEKVEIPVQVAKYEKEEGTKQKAIWTLTDKDNQLVSKGEFAEQLIPLGNDHYLGTIEHTFEIIDSPRKLRLEVSIDDFSNSWDIWVYPKINDQPESQVELITQLSPKVISKIQQGGNYLLSLGKGRVSPDFGGDVGVGFSSIFWNTAWTGGQKPHTLGILCDPQHPALSAFPSEYHSNWQWWDAMSHADAIKLNELPLELKPIVRIIDDWVSNRRLALIFEVQLGKGKILISGVDLHNNLENRPEARQLLHSLTKYISGSAFHPAVTIDSKELIRIVKQ